MDQYVPSKAGNKPAQTKGPKKMKDIKPPMTYGVYAYPGFIILTCTNDSGRESYGEESEYLCGDCIKIIKSHLSGYLSNRGFDIDRSRDAEPQILLREQNPYEGGRLHIVYTVGHGNGLSKEDIKYIKDDLDLLEDYVFLDGKTSKISALKSASKDELGNELKRNGERNNADYHLYLVVDKTEKTISLQESTRHQPIGDQDDPCILRSNDFRGLILNCAHFLRNLELRIFDESSPKQLFGREVYTDYESGSCIVRWHFTRDYLSIYDIFDIFNLAYRVCPIRHCSQCNYDLLDIFKPEAFPKLASTSTEEN